MNKKLIVTASVLLVLGLVAYFLFLKPDSVPFDQNSIRQETTSPSPRNSNPLTKQEDSAGINEGRNTSQVPVSDSFTTTITTLEQQGDRILIEAAIANSTQSGTCVVTFTNPNDRPLAKEFASETKDGHVSCKASISAFEFSYLGEWDVTVRYYVGQEQAVDQGKVVIK